MNLSGIAGLLQETLPAGAPEVGFGGPAIGPVPIEFLLFASVLACVAIFHHHTFKIAVTGVTVIALYKILVSPLETGPGLTGFGLHLRHEWVIVTNLGLLLLGFALLARHFEDSKVPAVLPKILPNNWTGGLLLLLLIAVLSSFLDNIAAAMIGGAMAHTLFRGKVHVGYLAGIIAASNAGGAGSVIGDTTTTMMWIAGVSPLEVIKAAVGAVIALAVFGIPAAIAQHRYSPIQADPTPGTRVDGARLAIVATILAAAITMNVIMNTQFHEISDKAPFLGIAVWLAILATSVIRKPEWKLLPETLKGTIFLLSLVLSASMMPVSELPAPGWHTSMGLGFLSAVFDNIPLTALTLVQGGYDWGFVAFAVGFGGSMIWFGSSAGVALSTMYPEAKNALLYLRKGWFVTAAYIIAFLTMLALLGYQPGSMPRTAQPSAQVEVVP